MRFKELRKKLQEQDNYTYSGAFSPAVGPHNPDGAVDTPEVNISSLTDDSLSKLNAFLGASFCRSYINPSNVLNQIRNKLQIVGLMFDYRTPPAKTGNETQTSVSSASQRGPVDFVGEGVYEFPLSYLGGSYGRYPTDPGYDPYHSDGISHKTGTPLVLCVHLIKNPNSTFMVKPYIKMSNNANTVTNSF
jgi:hypothetical protein